MIIQNSKQLPQRNVLKIQNSVKVLPLLTPYDCKQKNTAIAENYSTLSYITEVK
ncbi:MAG: hypothetical protein WBA41_21225 [Rivularia sp. (in: cyanobacteria)]